MFKSTREWLINYEICLISDHRPRDRSQPEHGPRLRVGPEHRKRNSEVRQKRKQLQIGRRNHGLRCEKKNVFKF